MDFHSIDRKFDFTISNICSGRLTSIQKTWMLQKGQGNALNSYVSNIHVRKFTVNTNLWHLRTFSATSFTHQYQRLILFQTIQNVIPVISYRKTFPLCFDCQRMVRVENKVCYVVVDWLSVSFWCKRIIIWNGKNAWIWIRKIWFLVVDRANIQNSECPKPKCCNAQWSYLKIEFERRVHSAHLRLKLIISWENSGMCAHELYADV